MATFNAVQQFNINAVDFNSYVFNQTATQIRKDANLVFNGITYPDEYFIDASFNGTLRSLETLGAKITADGQNNINGGTIGVLGELNIDVEPNVFTWVAQGFSFSATTLYEATRSVGTADDLAVLQAILAGNDQISLSNAADTMNGFAGNDQILGGGGNDLLDGGDGTDTAIYTTAIEAVTIKFDGNDLLVTTPNEGTDRLSNFEFVSFNGDVRLVTTLNDLTKPTVTSFSPVDGATNVGLAANIDLTFSEVIRKGMGTITLRSGSATGPIVEQFDASTSTKLTFAGNTLSIDPTANFAQGTKYFVTFDKGSVLDASGNKYDGTTTYDFTTFGVTAAPQWRVFAPNNFAGKVGGSGQVFGTTGFQDITVLSNFSGAVTFDPSFNAGGDIIRLGGNSSQWQVIRSGSSAVFSDGDTSVSIPLGSAGVPVVFANGTWILKFDPANGLSLIGNQSLTQTPAAITSNPDNPILPIGTDPALFARVFVNGGVALDGKFNAFGSNNIDAVGVLGGDVRLDPSFNRGGDIVAFNIPAQQFTAVRQGSSVVLDSATADVTIPFGETAIDIVFGGSDSRDLIFNAGTSSVLLGAQIIGTTPITLNPIA